MMSPVIWFFISSGIFLGWSLGANHAVNLFGTAVVSKMVKFKVAAIIAGVFVILGSVSGGEGVTKTINELGSVNAIAGSFTVALAVGISVTWMTKLKLPVSTSQAMVGAIVGWNIFTGHPTDIGSLIKIVGTWISSPVLAALLGFLLFKIAKIILKKARLHLLELDAYTRAGLIIVGAFASYSLGANNIANVMGIFVSATPLRDLPVGEWFSISGNSQLFFLGGLAIAIGIYTNGYDVMVTVGSELYKTTPISGLVVVLAESIVLFMFSSQGLESLLKTFHLPALPLVPLSSTQAVIGAVIGVGMAKDWRGINIKVLGKIASGWLLAPLAAGIMAFVALFFVQNVFEQKVIKAVPYEITKATLALCNKAGIDAVYLTELEGKRYSSTKAFKNAVLQHNDLEDKQFRAICSFAIVDSIEIDSSNITKAAKRTGLPGEAIAFCKQQQGKVFLNVPALEMFLWESKAFKQTIKAGDTLYVAPAVTAAIKLLTAGK